MSRLILKIDGEVYEGFKSLRIVRSVESISSYFSFDFVEQYKGDKSWKIKPQQQVEVTLEGVPLIFGFIDSVSGSIDGANRTYTLQGRDKTADLVDCSVKPGPHGNIPLLDLCLKLSAPFGIQFKYAEGKNLYRGPISNFSADSGETIFDALDRAAGKAGVLLIPNGEGGITIDVEGTNPAAQSLIEGENIKSMDFSIDFFQRYRVYEFEAAAPKKNPDGKLRKWNRANGQQRGAGRAPDAGTASGQAIDQNVIRPRNIYIQRPGESDNPQVKNSLQLEAVTRAGKSMGVNVTVRGWLQAEKRPWQVNEWVKVSAPLLGLNNHNPNDQYIIAEIEYSLSDSDGEITNMRLYPRGAFTKVVEIAVQAPKTDLKPAPKTVPQKGRQGNIKVTLPPKPKVKAVKTEPPQGKQGNIRVIIPSRPPAGGK